MPRGWRPARSWNRIAKPQQQPLKGLTPTLDVPANKPITAGNDQEPYDFWDDELKELHERYDTQERATFLERWHNA
jgi:hypothetical protein